MQRAPQLRPQRSNPNMYSSQQQINTNIYAPRPNNIYKSGFPMRVPQNPGYNSNRTLNRRPKFGSSTNMVQSTTFDSNSRGVNNFSQNSFQKKPPVPSISNYTIYISFFYSLTLDNRSRMIKKANPLQLKINKTQLRNMPQPKFERRDSIQPLKLPVKIPLPSGPTITSLNTPSQAPAKKVLKNSSRLTQTPRGEEYEEFEKNLNKNLYFKSEQRNELPRDPVKLIKLKLLKTKTEKNFLDEIKRTKDQNMNKFNKTQVLRMNQHLSSLNQMKNQKTARLNYLKKEYENLNSTEYNKGRFY